jgi:ABC-2 type transport system ATP-binding protein
MQAPALPAGLFAIEAENLVKLDPRPGRVPVLDGVTFGVAVGEVFALLGGRRAGKSTAVRVLTGAERMDAGRAWVAGHQVGSDPDAVRRRVGRMVACDGHAVERLGLTVRHRLQLAGAGHGLGGDVLRARVEGLLEACDLADVAGGLLGECPAPVSRRLDLAMALVHEPSVVFLDEPTAGLDPSAQARLWRLIERTCPEEGRTVLLATADPAEADRLASDGAVLNRGRIARRRPARRVRTGRQPCPAGWTTGPAEAPVPG